MPITEFTYVQANGRGARRTVYWESLLYFLFREQPFLVAARRVPRNSLAFATYLALRSRHRQTARELHLDGAKRQPLLPAESTSEALVAMVNALAPVSRSQLPDPVIREASAQLDEAAQEALVETGIQPGGDVTVSGQAVIGNPGDRYTVPTGDMGGVAGLQPEDAGWVDMGNRVYQALVARAQELSGSRAADRMLPVDAADARFALSAQLYRNEKLVRLVDDVMHARGGYVCPLVRHFVGHYLRCLKERGAELGRDDPVAARHWPERLASALGQAEADATGAVPRHELVVVGRVVDGELEEAAATGGGNRVRGRRAYAVDPASVETGLLLAEEPSLLQRLRIRAFARRHFQGRVERVRFADELAVESQQEQASASL